MIGAAEYESGHAVFEDGFAKVENEADGSIEQPHVAEKLCAVHGQDGFNHLVFHNQAFFGVNIQSQGFFKGESFVFDRDGQLADCMYPA